MSLSEEARARIRAEVMEVVQRSSMSSPPPRRVKKGSQKRTGPSRRGENLRSRPPKYDRSEIARLFNEGKSISEISKITGAHRGTISIALNDAGIPKESRRIGPGQKELCGKGLHDMSEHSRPLSGGGRYCVPCKSERGKAYYQRTKQTQD